MTQIVFSAIAGGAFVLGLVAMKAILGPLATHHKETTRALARLRYEVDILVEDHAKRVLSTLPAASESSSSEPDR